MKAHYIKDLSKEEQEKKLTELQKELMKLNAQVATGTNPKSPGQIKKIRKTIARIKTVQRLRKGEKQEGKQV